jgi:two-component system cell cycle response regulator
MGKEVVDTRVIALVLGVIGAAFGVASVVAGLPALGLVAGIAALLAGLSALVGARPDAADGTAVEDRAERDELLDATRQELAAAHERVAELEAAALATSATAAATPPSRSDPAALTDPASQLFSEAYFRVALQSRLASARRHLRPVAVCLVEVAEGQVDEMPSSAPPDRVAEAIRQTLREADIACRLDDGTFAVILEDTPENGAVWTVERIRRNLVSRFGSHTMWAGVACYPAHAFSTEELLDQARAALVAAQEWKQDRIEVAVAE